MPPPLPTTTTLLSQARLAVGHSVTIPLITGARETEAKAKQRAGPLQQARLTRPWESPPHSTVPFSGVLFSARPTHLSTQLGKTHRRDTRGTEERLGRRRRMKKMKRKNKKESH